MSLKSTKVKQVTGAWEKMQTNTERFICPRRLPETQKRSNNLQCQKGSMCLVARQTIRLFEYNYCQMKTSQLSESQAAEKHPFPQ